jgi:hypothetical protein
VGVQPTVEHSDSIIETVGGADRYEGLTAADGAGAGQGGREGFGGTASGAQRAPDAYFESAESAVSTVGAIR